MPEPITMALISGAVTAAGNAWAAYEQGKISEKEYKRQLAAANKLQAELQALRPSESWQDINPKLLGEVAKYSPDIANFVQENAPELIKESKSDREKQVQREALQKYSAMSETGRDVISDAQREQALFEADARAKQRQQRLMEGLKRQGMLGTGAGLAAQLQGEQDEAIAARQETLQGVQQAELRRRQALGEAASLAGNIRNQNLQVESSNVNTMNSFNQRLANAKNLYNQYASDERNKAQALNQQRQMAREQYNLGLENQYALYNREQREAARERAREFDVGLTNRMFDLRNSAEKYRADAQARKSAGYATAITSGLGAGLSAYGAGVKGNFLQNLAQGAATSAAQGYAERLARGEPENYVSQSSQTGNLYQSLYPYQQSIDNTPSYGGPLRPAGDNDVPQGQQYDWRDQPEILDELEREDYQRMKARMRRNTGGGY